MKKLFGEINVNNNKCPDLPIVDMYQLFYYHQLANKSELMIVDQIDEVKLPKPR